MSSDWTTDTLREYTDERFRSLSLLVEVELKRIDALFLAHDMAATSFQREHQISQDKFEAAVREGFSKQNEFRGALSDLGGTMSTRREAEALEETIFRRFEDLNKQLVELRSRVDVGPTQIPKLQSVQDRWEGRHEAVSASTSLLFACLTVLISIASVAVILVTHA